MDNSRNLDYCYMRRAIEIANRGQGSVLPNPVVGCVIVKDGSIVSEGYHQYRGSHHAEVNAILRAKSSDLKGATLYCTLEPCCHLDKLTAPCAQYIAKFKFQRVLIGQLDLNPKVSGKGVEVLRSAGIQVEIGIAKEECEKINKIFSKNMAKGLPYVLLKSAITLDGKIANSKNQSQWITDEEARTHAHYLRKVCGSIAIGRGTLEKDNPSLTIRRVHSNRGINRILVADISKLERKIKHYKLFEDTEINPTFVITSIKNENHIAVNEFNELGVKVLFHSGEPFGETVQRELFNYGVFAILVEGGAKFMSYLIYLLGIFY